MKTLYFTPKQLPWLLRKLIFGISHTLASLAPNTAIRLAYKYLFNPFSLRKYKFRNLDKPLTYSINTQMGDVTCMRFGNGERHILLSHGWGDTCLRFSPLIRKLIEQDYSVWCFDHIGHGKSAGTHCHVFACIIGLKAVTKFIEENGGKLEKIVTHSMGGLALLHMPESFFQNKKIISMSVPVKFLDAMYQKLDDIGISHKMMNLTLQQIFTKFNGTEADLLGIEQKHKIGKQFTYIHDQNDEFAKYSDVKSFLKGLDCQFITTEKFGHNGMVKNAEIIQKIIAI